MKFICGESDGKGYTCSLEKGHTDDHRAEGVKPVYSRWPNSANQGDSKNVLQQSNGGEAQQICPTCNGTGKAYGNTSPGNYHVCFDCSGSGKLRHC
jgi:DnaJ-class molecular chaperone